MNKEAGSYKTQEVFLKLTLELEKVLRLKGYSQKTIKSYKSHFGRFLAFIAFDGERISSQVLEKYSLHLLDKQGVSHSYVNQAINSIKFYLRYEKRTMRKLMTYIDPKKKRNFLLC
ncbi:MAG: phage integrase N-terminal SAM-like domain-containing protein [Bacillota bacterium]